MENVSIYEINGLSMGHYTDIENKTGCTFVKIDGVASVDVRGGAPASKELHLLSPENAVQSINGFVLTGGSAYGLESSSGVLKGLEEDGIGFNVGKGVVPIIPTAGIFDLYEGSFDIRPDKSSGYLAYKNLGQPSQTGKIGAGMGATIGKYYGVEYAQQGGFGMSAVKIGDLIVGAVVVVNAFGSVYDGNQMIAGAKIDGELIPYTPEKSSAEGFNQNTTIGAIVTNAKLSKADCKRLAMNTHDAYARSIYPVHTIYDGDLIFAVATGEVESDDMVKLSAMANEAMKEAIRKAVL